jgi:signal transduction histidine kinase
MYAFLQKIRYFILSCINIGITDNLSFIETKKIQLLNAVLCSGLPLNIFFAVLNFFQGKKILAIINIFLALGAIIILLINHYQRFLLARLVLTFLAGVLFTASAVLFRNGGEYYLITNLIIIIIYFNEKKYLIGITLFNCLLFIGVKIILNTSFVYETVSPGRVLFNIGWALLTVLFSLFFFKTELLNYQKQIETKNRELETLNATKQKLFSIISHDLRSPIGQLKGSLDLVNREFLTPEEFKKNSEKLSTDVDLLHNTLNNLLRWSISQFQGIVAVPEKINLASTVEELLTVFFRQQIEQKKLTITTNDLDHDLWIDPDHLQLIIRNLVSNAIKYSFTGGTISISAIRENRQLTITIADQGTGMSEKIKKLLFQTNSLVSNTGTSNEKGTGLGLKLCKEFIEKNNGHIRLESSEGGGSRFYVTLPLAG